ncbi:MAG: hypothetical protein AB7G06_04060 [Bdellovibrionales bacterium]
MKKLMLLAAVPALVLGLAACDDQSATEDTAAADAAAEMAAPAPVPPPVVPATPPADAGTPVDSMPMNTEGTNPASPTEAPAAEMPAPATETPPPPAE